MNGEAKVVVLRSALKYALGALEGVRDILGRGKSKVLDEAINRAKKALEETK